mmetsp:Transcript_90715/g.194566  ORF Transcript_90715/g.194566 Transcript_90715/m.194566 type:complete len:214 (-) Transcript_90715:963-1604(-)
MGTLLLGTRWNGLVQRPALGAADLSRHGYSAQGRFPGCRQPGTTSPRTTCLLLGQRAASPGPLLEVASLALLWSCLIRRRRPSPAPSPMQRLGIGTQRAACLALRWSCAVRRRRRRRRLCCAVALSPLSSSLGTLLALSRQRAPRELPALRAQLCRTSQRQEGGRRRYLRRRRQLLRGRARLLYRRWRAVLLRPRTRQRQAYRGLGGRVHQSV